MLGPKRHNLKVLGYSGHLVTAQPNYALARHALASQGASRKAPVSQFWIEVKPAALDY